MNARRFVVLASLLLCSSTHADLLSNGSFTSPDSESWDNSGWTSLGPADRSGRVNWGGGYGGGGRMAAAWGWTAASFMEIYQDVAVDRGMRLVFTVMALREANYNEAETKISLELLDVNHTPLGDSVISNLTGRITAAWQPYTAYLFVTNTLAEYVRVRIRTQWSSAGSGATTMQIDDAILSATPADSDLDGVGDTLESQVGTSSSQVDTDSDGILDGEDVAGVVLNEFWLNQSGDGLDGWDPGAAAPDGFYYLSQLESGVEWAKHYTERIRGFVYPPVDGSYTFYISGDNACRLYLSTDEDPANAAMIASVADNEWTSYRQWTHASSPVSLVGGQAYYIEVRHKQGVWNDHVSVAWTYPGVGTPTVIPGSALSAFSIPSEDTDSDGMSDYWEEHFFESTSVLPGGDEDDDDLLNLDEYRQGTDPNDSDTDGDGLEDGWEVTYGLDPLDDDSENGASGDPDQDGFSNLQEQTNGSDPTVANPLYVSQSGSAVSPYLTWATAANTIQQAVDAAGVGATVLVTNGTYDAGGVPVPGYALTNRVMINKVITVRSVNGPAVTTIKGVGPKGDAAVRCAYLCANAILSGFALTNGHTRIYSEHDTPTNILEVSGAGVVGGSLSNCILSGNSANFGGGGAYQCTLYNCILSRNSADYKGGGASQCILYNCSISSNSSVHNPGQTPYVRGGGCDDSTLYNCIISGNSSAWGAGGTCSCTLYNCTLSGNASWGPAGGAWYGTLYNCALTGNSANDTGAGGGAFASVLYNCTVCSNSAYSGGGTYGCTPYNCIVYFNTATSDASNYYSSVTMPAVFYSSCTAPDPGGVGNITANPMLFGYHNGALKAGSPCIDAGNNTYASGDDIDGNPRILDGDGDGNAVVDMGCSEYGVGAWVTSSDQSKKLFPEPKLGLCSAGASADYTVNLDEGTTYQTMEGFGGAMTESAAYNLMGVPELERNALFDELFTDQGLNMSCVRVPIGGSDYCLPESLGGGAYTYDDMPEGYTDPDLSEFSLARDEDYKLPALQEAKARKDSLAFMTTPWTAPAWMKNNESLFGGHLISAAGWTEQYSDYLVRFLEEYEAEGIPIAWLSLQNEPENDLANLPSMTMAWWDQVNLIVYDLADEVAAHSLSTELLIYDQNWDNPDYPTNILNDLMVNHPSYFDVVEGTAFHSYEGIPEKQGIVHDSFPTKGIYFSECTGWHYESEGQDNNFAADLMWEAHNLLISSISNYSKTIIFWNIALDEDGGPHLPSAGGEWDNPPTRCRGMITVNSVDKSVKRHVEYYVLGHLSKFVQPGSERIHSDSYTTMESSAFLNPDGSRALILLNEEAVARTVKVHCGSQYYVCTVPAQSVASLQW